MRPTIHPSAPPARNTAAPAPAGQCGEHLLPKTHYRTHNLSPGGHGRSAWHPDSHVPCTSPSSPSPTPELQPPSAHPHLTTPRSSQQSCSTRRSTQKTWSTHLGHAQHHVDPPATNYIPITPRPKYQHSCPRNQLKAVSCSCYTINFITASNTLV